MIRVREMLCVLLLAMPVAAGAVTVDVPEQFWLKVRSGDSVLAEPEIAQAVRQFLDQPRSVLIVRHAREDESLAHAEELRGWLIALGLEAGRIELAETNTADRTLKIEIAEHK